LSTVDDTMRPTFATLWLLAPSSRRGEGQPERTQARGDASLPQ
jgi:hypothetical protein